MTLLRNLVLEELERRNCTQTTRRACLKGIEDFAQHFHRSPDQLGLDQTREYQVHLFRVRKVKPATVSVRLAALRFLFVTVLKRPWTVADTQTGLVSNPFTPKAHTSPLLIEPKTAVGQIQSP